MTKTYKCEACGRDAHDIQQQCRFYGITHGVRESERYALASTPVTLNGKPASIGGVKLAFAGVRNIETGESYEWAWETVERIVANGGQFVS